MKSLITQIVIVLSALGLAVGAYLWWYGMVASESARSAQEAETITAKGETEKRAQAIAAAFAKLESNQGKVRDYFVSENNIVDFLGGLEKIGTDLGAKVHVMSVSPPSTKGDPVIAVNVSVEGAFDAVVRTVGAIEHAPYALTLATAQLVKTDAGWSASITLSVGSMLANKTVSTTTPTTAANIIPKP